MIELTAAEPARGLTMKDATREAAKKPRINFGSLYQISPAPTLQVPLFPPSTYFAKNTATKNAIKSIGKQCYNYNFFYNMLTIKEHRN